MSSTLHCTWILIVRQTFSINVQIRRLCWPDYSMNSVFIFLKQYFLQVKCSPDVRLMAARHCRHNAWHKLHQVTKQLYNNWHIITRLTPLCEELRWVFAHQSNGSWYWTKKFNNMCQVVLITRVIFAGMRLEQIVTCRQLKCLHIHNADTSSAF